MAKATGGTLPQQNVTVAESAHRACGAKARRKYARANEACPLLSKRAKEETPGLERLTLGDCAIAMFVIPIPMLAALFYDVTGHQ